MRGDDKSLEAKRVKRMSKWDKGGISKRGEGWVKGD